MKCSSRVTIRIRLLKQIAGPGARESVQRSGENRHEECRPTEENVPEGSPHRSGIVGEITAPETVASRSPLSMNTPVAESAKSDQILLRVAAESTPRFNVMDLKIFCSPTELAAPPVPL